MIEKREVKIAGDGEDVGDADLDEAAGEVAAEGGVGGVDDGGRDGVLDGGNGAAVGGAADDGGGGLAGVERSDFGVH